MLARPSTPSSAEAPATANETIGRDVTVVIAAWRAAGTIGRAVASALAQPEAAEVVVVDDASNDDGATLAAARAADDGTGRLTVLALDRNGGPSAARNAAIAASKAPWITILDSDDYFEPGRLRGLMALADKGYDLIADDLMQLKDGAPASTAETMWFIGNDNTPVDVNFTYFMESSIAKSNTRRREMGFLKPMMRRAFLDTHAIRYDERMRLGEDFDIYARTLLAGGRMRLIPWTGYISVMRMQSLSWNHSRRDLVELEAANDRLLESKLISSADAKLVRRHRLIARCRISWVDLIEALKTRNIFRASWVVLKDPRQAPYLARAFRNMIFQKLDRGKQN